MHTSHQRCIEFRMEYERGPYSIVDNDVIHDLPDLVNIFLLNLALNLLSEHLEDAILACIVDGEEPELSNCIPPLMPRSPYRLHKLEVDLKTMSHEVADIIHGGTNGMEDAGEIAAGIFVCLEWLIVAILH